MMSELHKEVTAMVQDLKQSLEGKHDELHKVLEKVCCLSWHDQEYIDAMEDAQVFVEVFDCRNALLPNLVRLCSAHDNVMDYMEIPHEKCQRVSFNDPNGYKEAKEKLVRSQK